MGRGMGRRMVACVGLRAVCSLAILVATAGPTAAATKHAPDSALAATSVKSDKQERYPPTQRVKKNPISIATGRPSETIQKQTKSVQTEFKSRRSKHPRHPRHMKVQKKAVPKAVVQPRTDLLYYGMLESQQRYDPRRNHLSGGVPDPHNPDLTHDHFQELDRNQDGQIDPVERTFGRPDMDRDLHNRWLR